ncbi:hypothetical protein FPSE_10567 [Fusarium pseudograminearum CS3096]|uniref:Uncharacterized protein n=1 Tax=Fusarium pseudograminearum (strain CS3096) TaxID=1028729 RepID=K3UCR7_FUSPC|nr:hypothetical protein FPSE_10567 [Fusarium pseudograminearum CS3096]EKJ69261.1 hypothetical protein FPSE_10567 [Fusarium pseudograminearum CS3096]
MTSDDSNNMFLNPTEELRAIFSNAQTKLRGMVPGYMVPRFFRTVFIPYQGRMHQVVLRKSNISVQIVKSDNCLVRFTESLCQKDSRKA